MIDSRIAAIKTVVDEDWHSGNIGERISRLKEILTDEKNPLEEIRKVLVDPPAIGWGKSPESVQLERIRQIVLGEPAPMSDFDRMNLWYNRAQVAEARLRELETNG